MSKPTTKTLVPALRFPDFRDAGAWEEKRLGDVATFSKGKGISKLDVSPDGSQPCIRYGELYTHYQETIDTIISYTNLPPKILVLSKKNDVIIPASGETQIDIATASCVVKSGVALGGDLNIIRTKMNGVFLSYYLNSAQKTAIARLSQGISVVHLYSNQLKTLRISISSPLEQQKIAACLTSVDDLITAQAQKLDSLKTHKKGLMQQLFPAEGETVPKLRFPEFRDAGAWEERRLGDVYSFCPTNSFSRDKLNYDSGSVKNIHYGDIHTKFSILFDVRKEEVPFVSRSQVPQNINSDSFCAEGDIIFADASEDLNDVGKSIEIVYLNNEKLLSGLHTILARQIESRLVLGFGGYLFKSHGIRKKIQRESQGAKVLGISKGRLETVKIVYPKAKDEQQKIAACLMSLDDLITAQAQKLDALKIHKKGLMQQLFPAADEVNA